MLRLSACGEPVRFPTCRPDHPFEHQPLSHNETSIDIIQVETFSLHLCFQEKVTLLSQVHAQESVIEGLKAERKIWGEELAQQGNTHATLQ